MALEAEEGGQLWTADEIRRVGYKVVDMIAAHLTSLPDRPVFRPYPEALAAEMLAESAPDGGSSPDDILADFAARVEPYPFGNGHPRFSAWVNSPPEVMGIFAEALAAAMNPSVAGGNHAAVYVERQVLNWFKSIVGFSDSAMGLLLSGGSMAALTALAVARHTKANWDMRSAGLQGGERRLIVYMSAEGHGCNRKATELLGIGSDNIRTIPIDSDYRMIVPALESAIQADIEAGHQPLAVVASAGTVNSGAIDPLEEIAAVAQRYDLWLHVDGAYGGAAILSERYRDQLAPLALADSIALDPHKWLYVPVEAGLVLVRDGESMRDAFSLVPPYLRTDGSTTGVGGLPWFSEYGFQQTRGFRALKVWMALKSRGLAGYAAAIDHDLDLAAYLAARVGAHPDLQLAATGLSIVLFRYAPANLADDEERLNSLNTRLLAEVQLSGLAFPSSTTLDGRFLIRSCIVNPRAARLDIDALLEAVVDTGARLAKELAPTVGAKI